MAKQGAAATLAAGLGATALCAGVLTFVPASGPGASHPERIGTVTSAGEERAAGATSAAAGVAAALSIGAAVLVADRSRAAARGRPRATVCHAEPAAAFAGGLVGGESAFNSFDFNFDPLGLATKAPQFLPYFRESELKHGRIAMFAWVGLVVPEVVRIPGLESCYKASVVDAHTACVGTQANWPAGPLLQVLMLCGILEMLTTFPKFTQGLTLENAGDYRLGVGFLPPEAAKQREMKLKELKNGRLAMLAFGGAITQAVLTGNGFPWLYASRPVGRTGPGLGSSLPLATRPAAARALTVVRHAENPYKMSKAVPFLPMSPALEGYVGAEEAGFDPIGVSLALDIRWLRESELKHGRTAMLATAGWIATDLGLRVPGEAFQVSTIEAHDAMVKFGSMPQLLIWLGYAELFGFLAINNMYEGRTDRKPGDFGLRLLYPSDAQGQASMQMKELSNGRLAMLAFSGIVTSAVLTGKPWPFFAVGSERRQQALFGTGFRLCGAVQRAGQRAGTSVHALEASASVPFLPKPKNLDGLPGGEVGFDPLGITDTFDVKFMRESELKHGRVCMLASVGFVATQFFTFPGVDPVPDSLQAFYTAPAPLWATLFFIVGFVESAAYGGKITMLDMFEDKTREPGNLGFGTGFLNGKGEKEVNDFKVKELSNGRLAMLAIAGMVHHNLVVKGPLFPLFPEGWAGPQGSWELESVAGRFTS